MAPSVRVGVAPSVRVGGAVAWLAGVPPDDTLARLARIAFAFSLRGLDMSDLKTMHARRQRKKMRPLMTPPVT